MLQAEYNDDRIEELAFKSPWSDACNFSRFGSSVIASMSFSGIYGACRMVRAIV